MDAGVTVQVEKFNAAMREMQSRLAGRATLEQIIDYEVSKIIEAALKGTDAATVNSIRRSLEEREWTTLNGKKYKLTNRYPNPVWNAIIAKRKASLTRRLAARGITKQSWLALARQIGFDIEAPSYVRRATVERHTNDENVDSRRDYKTSAYGLAIANHAPLLQFVGAKQAFFSAVVGRRKFFENNLKRGVFNDLAAVAAKYPGIKVTTAL